MALDNEQIIRQAYKLAENKDIEGWVAAFTDDGTFTDESIGVIYRGPDELPKTVEIYARAFPDMHRELYRFTSPATSGRPTGSAGNSPRPAEPAVGDGAADRQADGRTVLRRLRTVRRQDQAFRLLPLRHGCPHPARRDQ
jgi:hypothetical protein